MSTLDNNEARRFLDALDPSGSFTFQTFPEAEPGGKAAILHGSYETHERRLRELNETGAGVLVTINKTDGKGRKASNVEKVRALWVDLDGAPLDPVKESALAPSIIVQSSPGRYHCYWPCDDIGVSEFEAWQLHLAKLFDGDPSVHDPSRAMRLPGFLHLKREPVRSTVQERHPDRKYSRAELIAAFGEPPPRAEATLSEECHAEPTFQSTAKAVELAAKAVGRVAVEKERGRHRQALWLGYECRRHRLPLEDAETAARYYFELAPDINSDGEAKPLTEDEVVRAVLNAYRENKQVFEEKRLASFVLKGSEITQRRIEPRKAIIEPFLTENSLNMVFAERGLGKTWFAIELALAVAEGRKFFEWNVTAPKRVLYVDGEMPLGDLATRIRGLSGGEIPDNLMLLPSELLYLEGKPIMINTPEGQHRFQEILEDLEMRGERPDVLIFDNLSSLTSGMDENSNTDLDEFLSWMVRLRHQGYAVLVVHHAGKGGTQRGASRREDLLDTSIQLQKLGSDLRGVRDGACFEITFSKTRGMTPRPVSALVQLVTDEHGRLTWVTGALKALTTEQKALVEIYERPPHSQAELAERLGVSPERVSQVATKLRSKGWLAGGKGLKLTRDGCELAEKLGAADQPV